MKVIAYDRYGSFDVLAFRGIDKPAVKDGEVLVPVGTVGVPRYLGKRATSSCNLTSF